MRTVRKRTLDVIRLVPADKAAWRLSPDSMSVSEIVLHIASVEKGLWGEALRHERKAGKLDEFAKDSLDLTAALLYMKEVRAGSESFWSSLTTDDLNSPVLTPTGDTLKMNRWLVLAAEHEVHHRGFVHAYRKIWGLQSSPIYGLTYEELGQLLRS